MIFAVNKPWGMSSYDVIRYFKKKYPGQKIGHGGALDPYAEGVLILGIGRDGTKALNVILKGSDKVYIAEIELGYLSLTDDAEGPIKKYSDVIPSLQDVLCNLASFIGEFMQVPPEFSNIKIKGTSSHRRKRRGEIVRLEHRKATIHNISLLNYDYPLITIEVTTASGVYIRALARDIGEKLKTGAFLRNLKRTRVGDFTLQAALRIDQ